MPLHHGCRGGMWQDGTPVDIRPYLDMDGIKFHFVDTAAGEKSFEIHK